MMERFAGESTLPLTFDPQIARDALWAGMHQDILLVDDREGLLAGAVLGELGHEGSVETCAYLSKLYVEREFRGLGTSRALVAAFDQAAIARDARLCFASATAGMGDRVEALFVRLFERAGYQALGRVMVKDLGELV